MQTWMRLEKLSEELEDILDSLRREQREIVLTHAGSPVAVLRSLTAVEAEQLRAARVSGTLKRMQQVAQQIGNSWHTELGGTEILENMRAERDAALRSGSD